MNKTKNTLLILIFSINMIVFSRTSNAEISVGQKAPDFELLDQYSKTHKITDYHGKWIVLYFYPKDDTPGCTKEACNFRDDILQLQELNAGVLGISMDDAESHAKFAVKFGLPFPLLSDPDGSVAEIYGSLWSLGPIKFVKRNTFIIDTEGRVAKIYRVVKPEVHSREVINDLKEYVQSNQEASD